MRHRNALKVVQVVPAMQSGGVEQGVLEIAEALVAAGHESVVASRGGRLVAQLEAAGSRHVAWDIGRKHPITLGRVRAFRRWLAEERPDVLHVRSRLPAWVAWLSWRRMPRAVRPRFVTTVHGLYSVNRYSAVMLRGERVIAVSDTALEYIRRHYPQVDERRLRRIYRGVDTRRYHRGFRPDAAWLRSWREQYPQIAGKPLVVLPGRLTRLKGHHDFIDALRRVRASCPDVVGMVVGDADEGHRTYAAELRARDPEIVFTGHRSDLREIMAVSAAVASMSTRPESFGRTVLEALSLGTPVVGYDHGGVGEVLSTVFPLGKATANDSVAAARVLRRVLDDQASARRAVRGHDFSVQRMAAETLALYQELVAESAA